MKKLISMLLTAVMVFSLMSGVALASPTEACTSYVYGTFNGSPACLNASGDLHICEKNFPDSNFRDYINQEFDGNNDDLLTKDEIAGISDIICDRMKIKDLSGIEFFTALTNLVCSYNLLTTLDISKNTALVKLTCTSNQLTSLNVSTHKNLKNLYCDSNQLDALDVTANTLLTNLSCNSNNIKALDVSKNKGIESLDCAANKLIVLDLSYNAALKQLHCAMNQLNSLSISTNILLVELYCYYNNLTSLDISNNDKLRYLHCAGNELTTLDVTKNVELMYLYCGANRLKNLDVSKNINLMNLECQENNIISLDVSNNTSLGYLHCYNNQLENLDLRNIKQLSTLNCTNNQLSSLDIQNAESYPSIASSRQHKENVEYSKEGSTYKVDLGSIVGSGNINNIKSVSAKSMSGANLTASFDSRTGMATFAEEPSTVTYIYNVRVLSKMICNMDVILHMKKPVATGHTADHRTNSTVTRATISEDGSISTYCTECNNTISNTVIPRVSSIKLKESSVTYSGKVKYPTVVVKDRTGKTLKKDTDYKVSYKGFKKNVGIYTVTITFTGNYTGTKTLNHTIKPVTSSISKLTAGSKKFAVKWAKKATEVTGYQVQYSKSSKFSNAKTVTIGKNATTATTISKLTGKTKYYVRIRTYKTVKINGKAVHIFSDWSKAKTVTTKR